MEELKDAVVHVTNLVLHDFAVLQEEKESADAKLSKLKLQNKAKVASLTSQLEELKKQIAVSGGSQAKAEQKKVSVLMF